MWPWIKLEYPVAAFPVEPIRAEGMKAPIARVTQDRQFCVARCVVTYLLVQEDELLEAQRRVMLATVKGGGL